MSDTIDTQGSPELQKKLLEEFDSESRYRVFSGKFAGLAVKAFAILVALYHLYGAVFGTPVTLKHRSLHVASQEPQSSADPVAGQAFFAGVLSDGLDGNGQDGVDVFGVEERFDLGAG